MSEQHPTPTSEDGARAPIGARLRAARIGRGLTLEQVASATGLTKSFLSRLERDAAAASVASLLRVCEAVGITVGELFEPRDASLVRQGKATPINYGGEGVIDHLYTPSNEQHLQIIHSEIEPGGGSGGDPYTVAASLEFVYVLSGRLEVWVANVGHHLHAGDGLTFDPTKPHYWRNPSDSDVTTALWAILGAFVAA